MKIYHGPYDELQDDISEEEFIIVIDEQGDWYERLSYEEQVNAKVAYRLNKNRTGEYSE